MNGPPASPYHSLLTSPSLLRSAHTVSLGGLAIRRRSNFLQLLYLSGNAGERLRQKRILPFPYGTALPSQSTSEVSSFFHTST